MTVYVLEERLVYELHDQTCVIEGPDAGPARFCPRCNRAAEVLLPIIEDWIWNKDGSNDLD